VNGIFISFEGPEGCGKSTQARRLSDWLNSCGRGVVRVREPGGTPTGEAIRDILQHGATGETFGVETEVFLFAASRSHLVRSVILPALEYGKVVVSDRFADSTTAYQGYGSGGDVERILAVNRMAVNGALPDRTFLLDIDVCRAFERLAERNRRHGATQDRFEREDMAFHERVRQGYLSLARRWPERFRVIDADRSPDQVEADIRVDVERLLVSGPNA